MARGLVGQIMRERKKKLNLSWHNFATMLRELLGVVLVGETIKK